MNHENRSKLEECIRACLDCLRTCEECFGACVRMDMPGMAKCIQLCRDYADVCALAAQLMSGGSEFHEDLCALCARICEACAEECERMAAQHQGEHAEMLRRCAEACRRCAETCRTMAA